MIGLDELLSAKAAGGVRISVVVPARHEAATVGGIVTRVREEPVERVPLVDELVVIDSDSHDGTGDRARDAGAKVHAGSEILPGLEALPGFVVQPLAGEWAVRRAALAGLSVPVGYGVDLAALIDVHLAHGPGSIAQVDLGRRGHHHQSLRDLGAMALELIAVTDRRAGIGPAGDTASLLQFTSSREDGVSPTPRQVSLRERPPALTFAEFGAARGRESR